MQEFPGLSSPRRPSSSEPKQQEEQRVFGIADVSREA